MRKNIKYIFKTLTLFIAVFCLSACEKDEEAGPAVLEVTPANLNGTWRLVERNGKPLPEETYCYIEFIRRDKTFRMYDNFDSMYAVLKTGKFEIEKDDWIGYIISGKYDYGKGEWNSSYIVSELLETGSMVWTVKDESSDTQKFERCDGVPQEIQDEARDF